MKEQTRAWLRALAEVKNNSKAKEILGYIKDLESKNEELKSLYLYTKSNGKLELEIDDRNAVRLTSI